MKIILPDSLSNKYIRFYLSNIFYITGIKFKNDTLLNDWTNKNKFSFLNYLYSNILGDTLFAYIYRIPLDKFPSIFKKYYVSLFSTYGISAIPIDTCKITKKYLKYWEIHDFRKLMNTVKFTNSMGIYWLGYPDEKEVAKKYLIEYSGQDYDEPVKYLKWYRKNIFGVDY